MDMQQVWFAGAHCDIGGSYEPDPDDSCLSNVALNWMIKEAEKANLTIESHLKQTINRNETQHPFASLHKSRSYFYLLKKFK